MRKRHIVTIPTAVTTLAYIAGLIDGEGCIQIHSSKGPRSTRRSHSLQVSISNADPRLMMWLIEVIGGGVTPRKQRSLQHRIGYDWKIFSGNAGRLLEAVRAYLVIKSEQADLALAFLALNSRHGTSSGKPLSAAIVTGRESIRGKILRLNRKGA